MRKKIITEPFALAQNKLAERYPLDILSIHRIRVFIYASHQSVIKLEVREIITKIEDRIYD